MLIHSQLFRRIELQLLMNLTARAIGVAPKRIWTLPNNRALTTYAQFTRDNLSHGASDVTLQRMNEEAYKMGRRLRWWFRLRKQEDIERFVSVLYRHIGITIEGHIPGGLCFRHCYFSHFYTPAICRVASALDSGIISGLAGGGELHFTQRITEGHPCCIATFKANH